MTRVKICGVTRPEDARRRRRAGAWAIGMIFWPGSPRALRARAAAAIGAALQRAARVVGVFVNATLDEVPSAADRCPLTMLQLHGDEGPSYCGEAARRTGLKVMKAVRVARRGAACATCGASTPTSTCSTRTRRGTPRRHR